MVKIKMRVSRINVQITMKHPKPGDRLVLNRDWEPFETVDFELKKVHRKISFIITLRTVWIVKTEISIINSL